MIMQQEEEEEVCQKNTREGQLGKALVVSDRMYFMAYLWLIFEKK